MRVLHVVKTSEGAPWAARQARVLRELGVEVHVALPSGQGKAVPAWEGSGAEIHFADLNLPVSAPWSMRRVLERTRDLVRDVRPDIIHSHFVTTTCTLRLALGRSHAIPRVYQVAGPLHMEHWPSRRFELALAGRSDYWIASSRCIRDLYRAAGVPEEKLYVSYYGWFDPDEQFEAHRGELRRLVEASSSDVIVGNVNFMYPPKYLLGQRVGLKCHEDVIDALGEVIRRREDVLGVFVGSAWGNAQSYEAKLRARAHRRAGHRIRFTGVLPFAQARHAWEDFDLAVHVPLSENCGGVPEPLSRGVPVIASNVGALPEIVLPGKTGYLVPPRRPAVLAATILHALADIGEARRMAAAGRDLVRTMLDDQRTGREVYAIYQHLLGARGAAPGIFSSEEFLSRQMFAEPELASVDAAI